MADEEEAAVDAVVEGENQVVGRCNLVRGSLEAAEDDATGMTGPSMLSDIASRRCRGEKRSVEAGSKKALAF